MHNRENDIKCFINLSIFKVGILLSTFMYANESEVTWEGSNIVYFTDKERNNIEVIAILSFIQNFVLETRQCSEC